LVALALLAGCTQPGVPVCHAFLQAQLLLAATDDAAFTRFVDNEVTPRFPAGLTVFDTVGRWRTRDGRSLGERSKVLLIVAEPGDATLERLQAIRAAYKAEFRQESVGLVLAPVCADF
jgi:hypothetical protein